MNMQYHNILKYLQRKILKIILNDSKFITKKYGRKDREERIKTVVKEKNKWGLYYEFLSYSLKRKNINNFALRTIIFMILYINISICDIILDYLYSRSTNINDFSILLFFILSNTYGWLLYILAISFYSKIILEYFGLSGVFSIPFQYLGFIITTKVYKPNYFSLSIDQVSFQNDTIIKSNIKALSLMIFVYLFYFELAFYLLLGKIMNILALGRRNKEKCSISNNISYNNDKSDNKDSISNIDKTSEIYNYSELDKLLDSNIKNNTSHTQSQISFIPKANSSGDNKFNESKYLDIDINYPPSDTTHSKILKNKNSFFKKPSNNIIQNKDCENNNSKGLISKLNISNSGKRKSVKEGITSLYKLKEEKDEIFGEKILAWKNSKLKYINYNENSKERIKYTYTKIDHIYNQHLYPKLINDNHFQESKKRIENGEDPDHVLSNYSSNRLIDTISFDVLRPYIHKQTNDLIITAPIQDYLSSNNRDNKSTDKVVYREDNNQVDHEAPNHIIKDEYQIDEDDKYLLNDFSQYAKDNDIQVSLHNINNNRIINNNRNQYRNSNSIYNENNVTRSILFKGNKNYKDSYENSSSRLENENLY